PGKGHRLRTGGACYCASLCVYGIELLDGRFRINIFRLPERLIGRPYISLFGSEQPHMYERHLASGAVVAHRSTVDVVAEALNARLAGRGVVESAFLHVL